MTKKAKPPGKRRIMRTFKLTEVSLVGQGAQHLAEVVLLKSGEPAPVSLYGKATFPATRQAQGHSHEIVIGGNDGMLTLQLRPSVAEGAEASHTHPVLRTRSGYEVGVVNSHSHGLPNLTTIIEALLAATESSEPSQKAAPTIESLRARIQAEAEHTLILKEVVRLRGIVDAAEVAASKAAADERRADEAKRKNDQRAREALQKEQKMTPLQKRQAAENDLDQLAKNCHAEHPDLTYEGAYAKMLQTPKGRELYAAARAPIRKDAAYEDECESAIKASADYGEWDSVKERASKHVQASARFYQSAAHAEIYRKHHPDPVSKAAPAEMPCVSLGLLQKSEIAADPEAALEKLARIVAFKESITYEKAYATLRRKGSIGYEVALQADEVSRQRSAAAQA